MVCVLLRFHLLMSYVSSTQKIVGVFSGGLNAASTLSVIVVVIYGATLTIKGSMTPGSLTSFILYSLTGNFLEQIDDVLNSVHVSTLVDHPVLKN